MNPDPPIERPNIVVFMSDDHAQWAVGSYGNDEIFTPSIDSLAATGVQFDNAFTPIPVCSPSRASFWTGLLPSQHGMHDYLADAEPDVAAVPWLSDTELLARRLRDAGYTTALVGKWHAGTHTREEAGFDYWFSQFGPPPTPADSDVAEEFGGSVISPARHDEDDRLLDRHLITEHAIDFLRRRPQGRPFFLFVGHFATHSPWQDQPERQVRRYRTAAFSAIPDDSMYPFGRVTAEAVYPSRDDPREAQAQYYAAVSMIDEQVGRVIDELETQGLTDSTAVVYTADHGLNAGHHGLWGKGNATYPYNMLEESIRVPMIVHAPGRVLGRQRRSESVSLLDLHETIVDLAGLVDDDAARPGRSLLPLCRAESAAGWPDTVFGEYGDLRMARTRQHKLVRRYTPPGGELFDLTTDPRETTNVIGHPEYEHVVRELDRRIADYFERFERPDASGLKVRDLPRHNNDEAWREDGIHRLVADASWITAGAAATRSTSQPNAAKPPKETAP